MDDLPPILNDEQHVVYMAELTALIDQYGDADPDSEVGQRILALATVIETYEKKRWPI